MANLRKKKGLGAQRNHPTKRVVLSAQESKQLLTRTRIRDRVRDLLSRSAIKYGRPGSPEKPGKGVIGATAVGVAHPQYQLNLGKRTLLMLHAWKQPRRVMGLGVRPRPVNRFYASILFMILLIGASGSYTYHVASRLYDDVSKRDIATAVNWEGWVRKVSGKSHAFVPSRKRDQLLAQEATRAEERAGQSLVPKTKAKTKKVATPEKVQKARKAPARSETKVTHKKKRSALEEMRAWTRKRLPDVESVSVRD